MLPALPEIIPKKIQELPPRAAHFCLGIKKSYEALAALFPEGTPGPALLLAVSGGADSVSMLSAFSCLSAPCRLPIEVCHIDHGLRPESREEAAWVRALCKKMHIVCHTRHADIQSYAADHGMGLEEAGRSFRYEAFEAVRKERGLSHIVLAHTANDLAEDILMRLIRGTGWPALGGMPAYDEARKIIRPLLSFSRTCLEDFLSSISLPFLEDPSNQDRSFFRNRVRHILMPLFLRENPKFIEHMVELGQEAAQDRKYWNALLPLPGPFLSRSLLQTLPEAGRMRLYKRHVESLGCHPTAAALKSLDKAYLSGKGGLCIKFAGKGQAHVKATGILFMPPEHVPE